jgi:hypothetical protein
MDEIPPTPKVYSGSFSPWASRYNQPRVFGDVELRKTYTLRGVPYPVHVPNPPCGQEPDPAPNTARCLPIDDWFPINDPDIKGLELRSIRAFVEGSTELVFDDGGNAGFDYGNFFGLKAMVNYAYPSGIVIVIETAKSWANRNRGIEIHYVYLIKHSPLHS